MTTTGGATWTAANTGLTAFALLSLAVDPSASGTLYAGTDGDGVYKSTSAGASWRPTNAGLSGPNYPEDVITLAINPTAPAKLYAGGFFLRAFSTTDAGANWTAVPYYPGLTASHVERFAIHPAVPATQYVRDQGRGHRELQSAERCEGQ